MCEEIIHSRPERTGCTTVFHLTEILIIVAILQRAINLQQPGLIVNLQLLPGL